MLKSWSVVNFKPISELRDIQLAPVTLLAGLNSSGKSSFLQSILMIYQTLASRVLDRPLVTNGPILQLGTFNTTLHEDSGSRFLEIGFDITPHADSSLTTPEYFSRSNRYKVRGYPRPSIKNIKANVRFKSSDSDISAIEASKVTVEQISLQIRVKQDIPAPSDTSSRLSALPKNESTEKLVDFNFLVKNISHQELGIFLENVDESHLHLLSYSAEKGSYIGIWDTNEEDFFEEDSAEFLVSLSHFLPARLTRKFNVEDRRRVHLHREISLLFDYQEVFLGRTPLPNHIIAPDIAIPEGLLAQIHMATEGKVGDNQFTGHTFRDFALWFRTLKTPYGHVKANLSKKLRSLIFDVLINIYVQETDGNHNLEGLEPYFSTGGMFFNSLESAVDLLTRFFTTKIRYLGPLRADPQTPQRFSSSSEVDDVGAKGEFAAAVYDANHKASIRWYNPFQHQIESSDLQMALDSWVRYLGIASGIKIEEAGQSGVSWQVIHEEGKQSRQLSSVGVGVSQVLPILVMGLLAPSETLLIVEQPELHLHPRVQARLGDFFIGLSQCKKQCLIETHSENLVNQLRYHIVKSGGQEKSDCAIYFVDQNSQGATQFTPIEISPEGNILNWPEGFFDETMLQHDRMMKESIARRVKRGHHE